MSIMPISRDAIEEELELEKQQIEEANKPKEQLKVIIEEKEGEEGVASARDAIEERDAVQEAEQPLLFDKGDVPKDKPKKKKRQLSEKQLANLAKAREKSMARRKALKEAKEAEKEAKALKKANDKEEKVKRRMEQDEMLLLKAQMKKDAEKAATWDEDRLSNLIENALDKYIEKKKAAKPVPKVTIPPPVVNQHVAGTPPMHPKYYMPNTNNYQPAQYQPQHYQQEQQQAPKNSTMSSLFGNYQ